MNIMGSSPGTPASATGVTIAQDRDWLALAAALLAQALSIGTVTIHIFGVFVHPLQEEFGWTRTELAFAVTITQYSLGLTSPFWGILTDRFGPRVLLLPTIAIMSVLLSSLALLTPALWHFYLMFLLIPVLGTSPVLYSTVISRLFDKRLGLAMGLMLVGVGLGSAVLPPLTQAIIDSFGWRAAYVVLGVLTLAIGIPAALIATRHVRGPVPRKAGTTIEPLLPMVRTRKFALIVVIFLLMGGATVGTLTHLVPMMIDRGMSPASAAGLASMVGLSALCARGVIGYVLDRFAPSPVLAIICLLAVTAFLILAFNPGHGLTYVAAILLGVSVGAEADFVGFLTRRYFSPGLFGRMFGLVFLAFTAGGGTGPLLMGLSHDRLGGYFPGLMLFAGLCTLAAFIALMLPPIRRSGEEDALPQARPVPARPQTAAS